MPEYTDNPDFHSRDLNARFVLWGYVFRKPECVRYSASEDNVIGIGVVSGRLFPEFLKERCGRAQVDGWTPPCGILSGTSRITFSQEKARGQSKEKEAGEEKLHHRP